MLKNTFKSLFLNQRYILILLALLLPVLQPMTAYSITKSALSSVINNREFYDECQAGVSDTTSTAAGQGVEVGASVYGGSFSNGAWTPSNGIQGGGGDDVGIGNHDNPLPGTVSFAELDGGNALGGLKQDQKVRITYNGKSVVAIRADIGGGGGDVQGKTRAIDLWWETARMLDFKDGLGIVKWELVDDATPVTPFSEAPVSGGDAGSSTDAGTTPAGASQAGASAENLTIDQKIAGLVFSRAFSEADISALKSGGAGGIFARPNSANDSGFFGNLKKSIGDYGGFVTVDLEGGRVQAPGSDIIGALPSAAELGQKTEEEITTIAKEAGKKISEIGINMNFAPVVDIGGTNTAVIGDRAFANDAENVTKKAGAFADGMSQSNVVSVFKHFPGHGSREGDSHTSAVATGSLSELEGRDMKPYQSLKDSSKSAIMMGHLKVPDWGATPTSINPTAYTYLRDGLNYDGVVITDALDMSGLGSPTDEASRAVLAIKAGADVALLNAPGSFGQTVEKIKQAVDSGEISQERITSSFDRLMKLRSTIGATDTTTETVSCAPCQPSSAAGTGTVPLDGENPKRMFDYLISQQLSPEQAAGVVGNSMAESGPSIDPAASNAGNYRGIFQWDTGGRWAALVSWANSSGKNPDLFETQLEYAWKEASDRGNIEGLKNQNSVPLATWYWGRYFEVAVVGGSTSEVPLTNVQHLDKRTGYAQGVYDELAGSVSSGSLAASGGGSSSCGSGSNSAAIEGFPLVTTKSVIREGDNGYHWCYDSPEKGCHHDYEEAADIAAPIGTPVVTVKPGVIKFVLNGTGGCGDGLSILGNDNIIYYYTHMQNIPDDLKAGVEVTNKHEIGEVGPCTDRPSHLHFDMLPLLEDHNPPDVRPNCSGAECNGLPFINAQPLLVAAYERLPE